MARSTEQVFEDHKNAILNGDFPKLIADYADDAVLMTLDGAFVGKEGVQRFFQNLFASQPNPRVSFDEYIVEGDMLLLKWSAESWRSQKKYKTAIQKTKLLEEEAQA